MKPYDAAVVIGRFQIPHAGHIEVFKKANEIADKVIVLVGSVGQPKTPKNPFSFEERKAMLTPVLHTSAGIKDNFDVLPIRDQRYNLQHWIVDVVNKVNSTFTGWTDMPPKVALVGHKKDASSYYLDLFPQWDLVEVDNQTSLSSTSIRTMLFEGTSTAEIESIKEITKDFLNNWKYSEDFQRLKQEYDFIKRYKDAWKYSPYPPTFNTVDAVVIQSGHILMIKRRSAPGKGLWALPGGFLDQNETLRQAVIRELVEETKIKLQPVILDRNIKKQKVYDDPGRSERGRTITNAFLIELTGTELPRIKGGSDAEKAKWIPLNEIFMMGEEIYEDHLDIILNLTGDL